MLSLSRKQMMVLLFIFIAFVVTLVVSSAIISATNPDLWHSIQRLVVINNYS